MQFEINRKSKKLFTINCKYIFMSRGAPEKGARYTIWKYLQHNFFQM